MGTCNSNVLKEQNEIVLLPGSPAEGGSPVSGFDEGLGDRV